MSDEAKQFQELSFEDKIVKWSIYADIYEEFTGILAVEIRSRYTTIAEYDAAKDDLAEIFVRALSKRDQTIWEDSTKILGKSATNQVETDLKKKRNLILGKITTKHAILGRQAFTAENWNNYQTTKLKVIFKHFVLSTLFNCLMNVLVQDAIQAYQVCWWRVWFCWWGTSCCWW